MRFQVPQFIETEEKIIGPFTLKQFIFIAIGGALLFLIFFITPPTIFLFIAIPVGAIFLGLALLKIDDIPIYLYLYYFLNYLVNPRRYIYSPKKDS
ncbi:MAG: PrgI family protein [bacterium]|nr:PrgI family protein [bacterium]